MRAGQIRDAAAAAGMTQGWMLAGIAEAETGLAHCWSEATWACMGLNSPDCGGGPVIAGAGDGPCSLRQGGLGLFQFDGGTFEQTIARDGEGILLIAGNVQRAVQFVTDMVIRSTFVSGVDTPAQAIEWMNGVRINNGRWDAWISTVTRYYNGCRTTSSCWSSRYASYRDKTIRVYNEMGTDFWNEAGGPEWVAEYVEQGFPLAAEPFELSPGEEVAGHLLFRNGGTETWRPGEVFLGTTEPRDGASPLHGPDWVSESRAATVSEVTEPGENGRFEFTVRAPDEPGEYPQYFNFVREGEAWFSSPADNVIQIRVTVTPSTCAGDLSARWTCDGDTRKRCVMSGTEEEACMHGCLDDGGGAVCASPPVDEDGDGYPRGEDCDDLVADINPGAIDMCGDGLDANCDGLDCDGMGMGSLDGGVTMDPRMTSDSEGCSVSPTSSSSGAWALLALIPALLWRRRRG